MSTRSKPDWLLVLMVISLTLTGLIMVANASVVEAIRDFNDKFYYLRLQVKWAGLGLFFFFVASVINYRRLKTWAAPLMFTALFLLVVVLIPGVGIKALGARRWLDLGIISFQPAEFAKFALVVYLSSFLLNKKNFLPFAVLLAVLVILLMLEPDLGTTVVIIGSGLAVYFVSGAPLKQVAGTIIVGLISGLSLILFSSYRRERLMTFFDPSRDPLGASYHIRQILIALGSGGLFGVGFGQSRQKYEYLPEATTDSIFAVMAEETGLIGATFILIIFLIFIWRGIKIAKNATDDFGKMLALGITCLIGIQFMVNLAAMVALVPLTGIPLPFLSYGGSSLVLTLFSSGILVNISRCQKIK